MFAFKREAPQSYGVEDTLKFAANNSSFWDSTVSTQEYFQLQEGKSLVDALTSVIKDAAYDMFEQRRISTFQTSTQAFNYFAVLWTEDGSRRFEPPGSSDTLYIDLRLTQDCMPTYAEGNHTIVIQAKQQAQQPESAPPPPAPTQSRARGAATSTKFQRGNRVRWTQTRSLARSLGTVQGFKKNKSGEMLAIVEFDSEPGKSYNCPEDGLKLVVTSPLLAWRTGA